MTYGAIGSILGHELSHGFDNTGLSYVFLKERVFLLKGGTFSYGSSIACLLCGLSWFKAS